MIRATTGKPTSNTKRSDKPVIRPSSANAKLQSYAYKSLQDELAYTDDISKTNSALVLQQPREKSASKPTKPKLEHRLTLSTMHGIGEQSTVLTRLNTPASSTKKIKIEERITLDQLHQIKVAFEEADTDGSGTLDIEEFKTVVKTCLGVRGRNEEQIVALFMKIDSSSDGEIDWDEFCTYMQLEYAEKEDARARAKKTRFLLPSLSTTTPHHKAPVLRVICLSDTAYMCAGQDGLFSFWTTELQLKRTKSILDSSSSERQSYTTKPSVWVTDVAILPPHGKLMVATGDRELQFYELLTFEFYCQIIGLESVPLRVDVSFSEEDRCTVVFGDDQGCVSILMFDSVGDTLKSWKKQPRVNGVPTVTMQDVADGVDSCFVRWKVHNDWVTELRYVPELRSVISASNDPATALVRGCTTASTMLDQLQLASFPPASQSISHLTHHSKSDRNRKSTGMTTQRRQKSDQQVFYVYKGVKTFDICAETNIVATGGMDRIVRLWNPYVPQKPTGVLRGHRSPILFIAIAGKDARVFSFSADKCLKVWDLLEQNCLVTLNPKLHKISGEIAACFYANKLRTIAVASDHLSLLRISQRDEDEPPPETSSKMKLARLAGDMPISHNEPITCCSYNSSFGHVITASSKSVVKLWDFESGAFMFEFNKAHGHHAITSIRFDVTGRRLVTAGRDGTVKIWNYNNGHCLRTLRRDKTRNEITDCIYLEINNNRFIIAVGWDHRINIFPDEMEYFHHVQKPYPYWPDDLKSGHTEDIVAIAYGKPNMLATVSYDGLIIVWNIVSGHNIAKIPFPDCCSTAPAENTGEETPLSAKLSPDTKDGGKAVNKVAFLSKRLPNKGNGSLVAGCSDGTIIVWNIYSRLAHARFQVMERSPDLSTMVVTSDEKYLYVANHLGYITVWDIEDYGLSRPNIAPDVICPNRTAPPKCLASWRAHVQHITWIEVIESLGVMLTSSVDCTARLWTVTGQFIGTFGQSKPWDIYNPSTWQHPMVPPEVLLDPHSMPNHEILSHKYTTSEVVHEDSLVSSDSEQEEELSADAPDAKQEPTEATSQTELKPATLQRSQSVRRGSTANWLSGSNPDDAWRRRLSKRLSKNTPVISASEEEDRRMLDEIRQSMCRSAGKRLRHEKLLAQQRKLRESRDMSSHAFQTLQYFELGDPPESITKPEPRRYIDDVFIIQEEDEVSA